ncbi:MAG: hypothetical protein K8T20_12885 [Planctomycetes bacterium]|nr:hypothetical protein [Planctomycetota bacterium]
MDRLTREILEKIAKELGKSPDDPQVLQVVYKMVWELATGEKPADVKREPNPMLPPKDDPALRPPDAQDLTDLVDSILEDPRPRTEFLAKPRDVEAEAKSTGLWLKGLIEGIKKEPTDSPKRREMREWVAAPAGPAAPGAPADDRKTTDELKSGGPSADLAALLGPAPAPAAPTLKETRNAATVVLAGSGVPPSPQNRAFDGAPGKRGPKYARREVRSENPGETLTPEQAAKSAPAWLIALALHFLIAVVLMNIVYFTTFKRSGEIFRVALAQPPALVPPTPPPGDQTHGVAGHHNEDSLPAGNPDPMDPNPTGLRLPEIPKDMTAPTISLGSIPTGPGTGTSGFNGLGGLYAGRGGQARRDALLKNGGDDETEAAVERGLKWLQAHQGKAGWWGAEWGRDICTSDPPCGTMASRYPVGTTALCLLAFIGAGHTHLDGQQAPYVETIKRAAECLSSRQMKDGHFEETDPLFNYSHAIATYALCELLAMTQDPRLRPVCERAVGFIVASQQENGGWDYDAQKSGRGDVSISGWMVMALRSARAAGLAVPTETWQAARKFYVFASDEKDSSICYYVIAGQRQGGTPATQASGVLARNYLGLPRGGPIETKLISLISKTPPSILDPPAAEISHWHHTLYYVYYATLVMFYNGGEEWKAWNKLMKREVLAMQSHSGHEDGSFLPRGNDTGYGGRAYSTAMGILNLEVYYRYLPSYKAEVDLLAPMDDPNAKSASGKVKSDTLSADLIEFLHREDTVLRRAASRELCRRKEEGALKDLLQVAKAESSSLKILLIEDLAAFGENVKVLGAFVEWLDAEPATRAAAVRALKKATGLTGDNPEDWRNWWAGRSK